MLAATGIWVRVIDLFFGPPGSGTGPAVWFIMSVITMCTTKLRYSIPRFGFMAFCLLWGGATIGAGMAAGEIAALTTAETAEAAPNAVLDDPEPYVSQKGRFRFRFPGKPEVSDQKTNSASGPLIIHVTSHVDPKGTNYVVTYLDLDPAGVRAKAGDDP